MRRDPWSYFRGAANPALAPIGRHPDNPEISDSPAGRVVGRLSDGRDPDIHGSNR